MWRVRKLLSCSISHILLLFWFVWAGVADCQMLDHPLSIVNNSITSTVATLTTPVKTFSQPSIHYYSSLIPIPTTTSSSSSSINLVPIGSFDPFRSIERLFQLTVGHRFGTEFDHLDGSTSYQSGVVRRRNPPVARRTARSSGSTRQLTSSRAGSAGVGVPMGRCAVQTFETCLAMMQEVMENSSLAFPTNSQTLDITCRYVTVATEVEIVVRYLPEHHQLGSTGDYCAERYIRSCAGDQQRLLYQDIVQGSKNVIRHLCQHGETQQLYLQYASCFKDISVSKLKCSTVLRRFQEISRALTETNTTPTVSSGVQKSQKNDDESLQKFCCAYRDSVDCQVRNVRKWCGQKGLQFFERYMAEMTNSLINEHCIGYTYSDKCRPYQQEDTDGSGDHVLDYDTDSNGQHSYSSQADSGGKWRPKSSSSQSTGLHTSYTSSSSSSLKSTLNSSYIVTNSIITIFLFNLSILIHFNRVQSI